ncbi:MAG: hemin uptake protein HemP [Planctomycetota bacterium]|nr:hemin uptake protein HemP [Planctomycetota bacterium]
MDENNRQQEAQPSPELGREDSVGKTTEPRLPKIISFRDLCRCGDEVWIEHAGQLYRLRCTKQGKLLLTK